MPLTAAHMDLIAAANAAIDAVPRGTVQRQITDQYVHLTSFIP
jgi:hypothetical protein